MTTDPFERAAEREEHEEFRREIKRMSMGWATGWARGGRSTGLGVAIASFGIPYVIWGLIRAAGTHFGHPTIPQSLVHFFFQPWWGFGLYTGWMLFLLWSWAIVAATRGFRS